MGNKPMAGRSAWEKSHGLLVPTREGIIETKSLSGKILESGQPLFDSLHALAIHNLIISILFIQDVFQGFFN
ncbi:MAG: hypothetical protein JWR26_850 [Pedosphaera sp.]|nr:hypothetical protein [Pedosphaera sp.]